MSGRGSSVVFLLIIFFFKKRFFILAFNTKCLEMNNEDVSNLLNFYFDFFLPGKFEIPEMLDCNKC